MSLDVFVMNNARLVLRNASHTSSELSGRMSIWMAERREIPPNNVAKIRFWLILHFGLFTAFRVNSCQKKQDKKFSRPNSIKMNFCNILEYHAV